MSAPRRQASAFAPASVGNIGVGFDVLGHAIAGAGDRVTAVRSERPGVRIAEVAGLVTDLPEDPLRNTAGKAALEVWSAAGMAGGVELRIDKGISLGSGMGGSAASAVAAALAVNALCDQPLPLAALYPMALAGEAVASGAVHGDNVAASLLGGITMVTALGPRTLNCPPGLTAVLVHPRFSIRTEDARACLPADVPLSLAVDHSAALAMFVLACERADLELLARSMVDALVEPHRAHLIPGFAGVREAAYGHGALGCSISGAGPSVFAWFADADQAAAAGRAMQESFASVNLESTCYVTALPAPGARLLE